MDKEKEFEKIREWLEANGFKKGDDGLYTKKTPLGRTMATIFGAPFGPFRMTYSLTSEHEFKDMAVVDDATAEGLIAKFKARHDNALWNEDHCRACGEHWTEHDFGVPEPYCPKPRYPHCATCGEQHKPDDPFCKAPAKRAVE